MNDKMKETRWEKTGKSQSNKINKHEAKMDDKMKERRGEKNRGRPMRKRSLSDTIQR